MMYNTKVQPYIIFLIILALTAFHPPRTTAETFPTEIDVLGTPGDDTIDQLTPVEATIDKTTDQSGILNVSATGIDSLSGDDTINTDEGGTVHSNATSSALVVHGEEKVEAQSFATGIDAGSGTDNVTVSRSITSISGAAADITEFSLTAEPLFIDQGSGATAESSGIAGGSGTDSLINNDQLTVNATADNAMKNFTLTPVELPADVYGYGIVPITANARAVGISGGSRVPYYDPETEDFVLEPATSGVQLLVNNGSLIVSSSAVSRDLSATITIYGQERGFADLGADAISVAMIGSDGTDEFTNSGILNVDAAASSNSLMFDIQFKLHYGWVNPPNPPQAVLEFFGVPLGEGNTRAAATAIGFYGGSGNNTFTNNGPDGVFITQPAEDCDTSTANICATATVSSSDVRVVYSHDLKSSAAVTSLTATIGGALLTDPLAQENGQEGDVSVTKSSTLAEASAYGFWGGDGQDTITNMSPLSVESFANSKSTAVSLGVNPDASGKFPFSGLSIADGDTLAEAQTIGIVGGGGSDIIDNQDGLGAFATADAKSTSVTTDLNFDATDEEDADGGGFVLSTGFAKASTTGKATAVGIGGSGGTKIDNSGHIVSYADSESDSDSVSVEIAINHDKGDLSLAGAGSFTKADSSAEAYSYGIIDLGEPASECDGDSIDNKGIIDATAIANAESRSASATLSYAYKGISAGFTFADAGTKAYAEAGGITRSAGEGPITNSSDGSEVNAEAEAIAKSTTVGLTVNITPKGGSLGGAVGLADTEARALSAGISAGIDNDTITSETLLTSKATAEATSGTYTIVANFTLVGLGATSLKAGTISNATAIGIESGDGRDGVTTDGIVDVDATATTRSTSFNVTASLLGATFTDVKSTAFSTAIGVDGGSGPDTLMNYGNIEVDATSQIIAGDYGGSIISYASADAIFNAEAHAYGINAGDRYEDGNSENIIINKNGASIHAHALGDTDSEIYNGFQLAGAEFIKTGSTVKTYATGMVGGHAVDTIINKGIVNSVAESRNNVIGFSFTGFGYNEVEADISSHATAAGIDAGEGENKIYNLEDGLIDVHANVDNLAGTVGTGILTLVDTDSSADATAIANGISSGSGYDFILNEGEIDVTATVFNDAGAGAMGLFASSSAEALAVVTLKGIDSGSGNDRIKNEGFLTVGDVVASDPGECIVNGVHYDSIACARAGSLDQALISIVKSRLGSTVEIAGIDAGDGDDVVINAGEINIGDSVEWMVVGEADTIADPLFTGLTIAEAYGIAELDVVGVEGGLGNDKIYNQGIMNINARSYADAYAETSFVAGFVSANISVARSTASAVGIRGGEGDDLLENNNIMNVAAYAKSKADAYGTTTSGILGINSSSEASAIAIGMDVGLGINNATNLGDMDVQAASETETTSYCNNWASKCGSELNNANLRSNAWGILGNSGDDILGNAGKLTVTSRTGEMQAWSLDAFGEDTAFAIISMDSTAIGIESGEGHDEIWNAKDIAVNAVSYGWGKVRDESDDSNEDDLSDILIESKATALGLKSSGELSTITNTNTGKIDVTASAYGRSDARSNTEYGGTSWANATADARTNAVAAAAGIFTEGGYATIDNDGSVNVAAYAKPHAGSSAAADSGTAESRATGDGKATAIGFQVGDSGSLITNGEDGEDGGVMTITAVVAPNDLAGLPATVPPGAGSTTLLAWNSGEENTKSWGFTEALSVGIKAGAGYNIIENYSEMVVSATADNNVLAYGGDTYTYVELNTDVSAIGISAGVVEGNETGNVILNKGIINVSAMGVTDFTILGNAPGYWEVDTETSAIGIETGGGDDDIFNYGAIVTKEYLLLGSLPVPIPISGTGISTGAGNDKVYLRGESLVDGSVQLGDGDDLLTLKDSAKIVVSFFSVHLPGIVDGGEGVDTLRIDDRNSFSIAPPTSMENIYVNQGQLIISGDYDLAPDGLLHVTIYNPDAGQLGYGQLVVAGDATVDGGLSVTALPRLYLDGETFDIMTADGIDPGSDFSLVDLPETTPLVSFSLVDPRPEERIVRLETSVNPFTAVALTPLQMTIASYLDRIAPIASDELKTVLGHFQQTPLSGIPDAFASFSPDSYQALSALTVTNGLEYLKMFQKRFHTIWSHMTIDGFAGLDRIPYMIAYNGDDAGLSSLKDSSRTHVYPRHYLSLDGFVLRGDQGATQGYAGYDFTSENFSITPQLVSQSYILGASVGVSDINADFRERRTHGDIFSWHVGLYGSRYWHNGYLEAGVSYSRQEIDNKRTLQIGDYLATANSEHESHLYQGFVGAGYKVDMGQWVLLPKATLYYGVLDEEGFKESGAGDAGLTVEDEKTQSLVGEAELGLSKTFAAFNGSLTFKVSAGVSHDFRIDDYLVKASLQGAPGAAFTIDEADVNRTSALFGAELYYERESITAKVEFHGHYGDDYERNMLLVSLGIKF